MRPEEFKQEGPIEVKPEEIRAELLDKINWQVASVTKLPELVEHIVRMAQKTLKAEASSVLLLDEVKQELYFEIAEGKAGRLLRQIRISAQSGIAGWVVQRGQPLVINDVSRDERFYQSVDNATGFITKSILCVPLAVNTKIIGVLEVLNKKDGKNFTQADLDAISPVASIAAISIENTKLHQAVTDGYKSTIKALAATIDAKDPYTCGHSQRVMEYALLAADALCLPSRTLEAIEYGSILHDAGKIGIPDSILCKPAPLTTEESTIMRQHPTIGANIVKDIPFLEDARTLILHHHESYDGTGYPGRLHNPDIPVGALVIAVADTFDTMTTDRAYRPALAAGQAVSELHRCSGTQFCPEVVSAFISALKKRSLSATLQKVRI